MQRSVFFFLLFIYCDVVLSCNKTTLEALTAFPCKQTAANLKSASVSEEWIITNVRTWTLLIASVIVMVTFDMIRSNDMKTSQTSWTSIIRCLLISRHHDLETACTQHWRCPAITNPSLLRQDRRLQNVVAGNIELLWAGESGIIGSGCRGEDLGIIVNRRPKILGTPTYSLFLYPWLCKR